MKKRMLPILLAGAVLCGCASAQPQSGGETAAGAELPPPVTSQSGYAGSSSAALARPEYLLDTWELGDSCSHEDGTLLAQYHFDLPRLTAVDETGAPLEGEPVAERFNEQFRTWATEENFSETARDAAENYESRKSYGEWVWEAYDEQLSYTAYRTDRLISIAAECWSYTGGAHGNTSLLSWNYDLELGEFFSAAAISDDPAAFSQAVTEELTRQARGAAVEEDLLPEDMYWQGYEAILSGWSSYAVSFDGSGMTVAFSPYELACYAAGPQVFHLDYAVLEPHLSDYGRAVLALPEESAA